MKSSLPLDAERMAGLPGSELILEGLGDAFAGLETPNALLVEIAAPRLEELGIRLPKFPAEALDAEIRLCRLLGREFGADAYGQYNSLLRRLMSFIHAMERGVSRAARDGRRKSALFRQGRKGLKGHKGHKDADNGPGKKARFAKPEDLRSLRDFSPKVFRPFASLESLKSFASETRTLRQALRLALPTRPGSAARSSFDATLSLR